LPSSIMRVQRDMTSVFYLSPANPKASLWHKNVPFCQYL
jgi:hypothetical protein